MHTRIGILIMFVIFNIIFIIFYTYYMSYVWGHCGRGLSDLYQTEQEQFQVFRQTFSVS